MDYKITYRTRNNSIQCIISYKNNDGEWKTKSKQGFRIQKDAKPWQDETLEAIKTELNHLLS